ncbi:mariner Mos1 transposase [Trichonephila clavipes]|nr:mariner Mos1 transposase [Trichonephila clavipes]
MCTVFWDSKGILLIDFLLRGQTINAAVYCETLRKLRRAIQNKRRGFLSKSVVFLHDNARPHTANVTKNLLRGFGWDVLDHPPYSPDLAPSDFHLFLHLKSFLAGFCASFKDATLYEASATFATPPEIKPGSFAQFVHDNADFNINTIDGKCTFHYMRSIEIITPDDSIQPRRPIKRLKTLPPESEFAKKGNIPLQMYPASVGTGFSNIIIKLSEVEPDIKKSTTNGQLNIL